MAVWFADHVLVGRSDYRLDDLFHQPSVQVFAFRIVAANRARTPELDEI